MGMLSNVTSASTIYLARSLIAVRVWAFLILGMLLFGPPVPLPGLQTESKISLALVVGVVYLVCSLPDFLSFITFLARRAFPVLVLVAYALLHLVYVLLTKRLLPFLLEAQWLLYILIAAHLGWAILRRGQAHYFASLLVIMAAVLAVLGILTSFFGPIYSYGIGWTDARFGLGIRRALATLDSANGFGGLMGALTLFIIFRFWKKSLLVGLPLGLLCAVATAMSLSKSAALSVSVALGLSLILFFVLHRAYNAVRLSYWTVFVSAFLAVVTAAVMYFPILSRLLLGDASGRTQFGVRVLEQYANAHWLDQVLGQGFRMTAFVDPGTRAWVTAHNSYISLLAEFGPLGLFAVVSVIGLGLFNGLQHGRVYVVAPLLVIAIHMITEGFVFGGPYIVALVLIAVLSGVPPTRRRR